MAAAKVAKDETEQTFSSMRAQGVGCTEVSVASHHRFLSFCMLVVDSSAFYGHKHTNTIQLNREILDTINGKVLKERMEMKINRAMNERLNAVLIDISQGASGLSR